MQENISLDTFTPTYSSNLVIDTSMELQQVFKELGDIISQIQDSLMYLPDNQYEMVGYAFNFIKYHLLSYHVTWYASASIGHPEKLHFVRPV